MYSFRQMHATSVVCHACFPRKYDVGMISLSELGLVVIVLLLLSTLTCSNSNSLNYSEQSGG